MNRILIPTHMPQQLLCLLPLLFLGLVTQAQISDTLSSPVAQQASEDLLLRSMSLTSVIDYAQMQSLEAEKAENRKENSYWAYQRSRSMIKPSLSLQGNLPDYQKSIIPVIQPDGSQQFKDVQNLYSDVRLSLDQNILWTGGSVSLFSSLERNDVLLGANEGTSYASQPLVVGIDQPLFAYNPWKWNRKIDPLRYEESVKRYKEENVRIAHQTTELFFDLLLAQIRLRIAQKNKENSDINYKIGQGRFNLGKIAENELLELELNQLNAERDMANAKLQVETNRLSLNTFIGSDKNDTYNLLIPDEVPEFDIDLDKALSQAKLNRQQYVSFKRRLLEAESQVAQAKSENTLNINLRARIGLTDQGESYRDVYGNAQNTQRYAVGVNVPILDWNRRKSSYKTALANQHLVENTIEQEEQLFEAEIITLVKQMPTLRARVLSTKRGDEIANRRYDISQERYLVANITVTDLNLALQAKDQAKEAYLRALREYWMAYYQLRYLTLYDFVNNQSL
ncbi:TolC family protein [Reichenbachiella ulvae]|uniref:TolC family protein n=1 Tax=Reichenbachiella ulvae TaxID=2980104 RepID=A0ABT3CQW2_9BACT|nr:TolC family protein [Reichenbachiella ulvae]MCV9386002.1 TolC family protein [Reichenbachiella ulvae]